MTQHVYTLLCKRVIADQATNALTLVDCIEDIEVFIAKPSAEAKADAAPPALQLDAFLVSLWTRDSPDEPQDATTVRALVLAPNGKQIGKSPEQQTELTSYRNYRVVSHVPRLPLHGSGRYVFRIQAKKGTGWRTVANVPLTVQIKKDEDIARPTRN